MVFAGVGLLSSPIDWIQQFLARPKSTITKSEYIRRGRIIAQRAKDCVVSCDWGLSIGLSHWTGMINPQILPPNPT